MDITSNHLDVVPRGGYGWREEVDDGEEIARRSETFGHPVGKSASPPDLMGDTGCPPHTEFRVLR